MRTEIESWLASHCTVVDGVLTAAVLLRKGDGLQSAAIWPSGSRLNPALLPLAGAALARRDVVSEGVGTGRRPSDLQLIAHPLAVSDVVVGAVVIARPASRAFDDTAQAALATSAQAFSQAMSPARSMSATAATTADVTAAEPADRAGEVLALAHLAFEQTGYRAAATALLSALAAKLGCDRASLGFRTQRLTCVDAVSDGSKVDPDRGAFPEIAAAMDEAIDEGASLVYPPAEASVPRILAAHACMVRRHGLSAMCSVPLVHGGKVVGALALEFSNRPAPIATDIELLEAVCRTVAPWLVAQRDEALPWTQRLRRRVRDAQRLLGERGHGRYKLAATAAVLTMTALLCIPARQEVCAQARLEGTTQRVLAAPSDGYLKQVFVRPGDAVKAGQTLLEFEGEDLQVERQRLAAELAGQDATVGDAMQKQDLSRLAIASARVDELKAQIAAADQRIERAQMKAPFDGVVISGDLAQALGAPVKRGAGLLTLAPSEGFRAIVEVEDADITEVAQGQRGSIVLTSHPEHAWPMTVARITPLAAPSQGRNVFEVEVALDPTAAALNDLRPGMRGVARLHVGDQPRALGWGRDALAWVRLATWRWVG